MIGSFGFGSFDGGAFDGVGLGLEVFVKEGAGAALVEGRGLDVDEATGEIDGIDGHADRIREGPRGFAKGVVARFKDSPREAMVHTQERWNGNELWIWLRGTA